MSKKNNVNPDHYKTAGRDRQGQAVAQELHRGRYAKSRESADVGAPVPPAAKATRRRHVKPSR